MATKQYSIGYEEGFQNGWNAAVDAKPEQPAQQEPVAWAWRAFDPDDGHYGKWDAWKIANYKPPRQPSKWFQVVALPCTTPQAQPAPAPGYCKNCKDYTIDAPLAEQPAQQEPVGALILGGIVDTSSGPEYEEWDIEWNNKAVQKLQEQLVKSDAVYLSLHTSPPANKPLTEEQIFRLPFKFRHERPLASSIRAIARAIEAAHGIKENT